MSVSTPARGYLESVSDPKLKVDFHFNPKELAFKKSYIWEAKPTEKKDTPKATFGGGQPSNISLSLLFDTYERSDSDPPIDVRTYTGIIFKMAQVNEVTSDASAAAHPHPVKFVWGPLSFQGRITDVGVTYTLFHSSGVPLRATVTVTIQEEGEQNLTSQNPTSRGLSNMRLHRIVAGETLPHIAQQHYGDCNRWREIASANHLTRVRRLTPGLELRIPNV